MVLVTIVVGVLVFLIGPGAPLGSAFWNPSADVQPTSGELAAVLVASFLAALAFGFGTAFLLFGWKPVKGVLGPTGLAGAVYLSLAYLFLGPWVHDSLHAVLGLSFAGILLLGYLFHLGIIPVALVFVAALFRLSVQKAGTAS